MQECSYFFFKKPNTHHTLTSSSVVLFSKESWPQYWSTYCKHKPFLPTFHPRFDKAQKDTDTPLHSELLWRTACQLKGDSFSLGHLTDGRADENQIIPRERKECQAAPPHRALSHSQLRSLITQGRLLCALYAWHSCKEHSCFSPKLLKVCELFCLQQPHPLGSHGSCCTLLFHKGFFFFFAT